MHPASAPQDQIGMVKARGLLEAALQELDRCDLTMAALRVCHALDEVNLHLEIISDGPRASDRVPCACKRKL